MYKDTRGLWQHREVHEVTLQWGELKITGHFLPGGKSCFGAWTEVGILLQRDPAGDKYIPARCWWSPDGKLEESKHTASFLCGASVVSYSPAEG